MKEVNFFIIIIMLMAVMVLITLFCSSYGYLDVLIFLKFSDILLSLCK